ncbi:MAG: TorF family putative porin [Verrucomicrobiota bacterium]
MRKIPPFALLGALLAASGASSSHAQTTTSTASSATWTLTPAVVSQYMFRGVRLGGPAFQPNLDMTSGDLSLGIWASTPIKDEVPGVSDPEVDLYGSYNFKLNDAASFAIGATWYIYPDADKSAGFYKQTFEPSIAFNYTINGLRLTPKVYYDLVLEGPTAELTAFYALPLKELGTELDFTATVGTYKWENAVEDALPDVANWGSYWSAGVALPFQFSTNSKLTVGIAYVRGYDNEVKQGMLPKSENTAAVGRGVVSLSYSFTF